MTLPSQHPRVQEFPALQKLDGLPPELITSLATLEGVPYEALASRLQPLLGVGDAYVLRAYSMITFTQREGDIQVTSVTTHLVEAIAGAIQYQKLAQQ